MSSIKSLFAVSLPVLAVIFALKIGIIDTYVECYTSNASRSPAVYSVNK